MQHVLYSFAAYFIQLYPSLLSAWAGLLGIILFHKSPLSRCCGSRQHPAAADRSAQMLIEEMPGEMLG